MNYANMIEEKNLKKTFIIATLVSTIIGTFTTGMGLFERLDQKRKQKKVDSTQDDKIKDLEKQIKDISDRPKDNDNNSNRRGREEGLRDSLQESGPLIRREYNRDFARFGDRFAIGDSITENQLQGQIITLQGTVIQLLDDALRTGRLDNINKLYNATELARDGSLAALQGQYQRMLQAAPLKRPMPMRRISSQPSIVSAKKSLPPLSKAKTAITQTTVNDNQDDPLFCRYSYDLQRDGRMPLAADFQPGGNGSCRSCGVVLEVEPGRAWKITKEVIRERITTADYDEEVVEERIFLVSNRFVVKCHRSSGGYACALCTRYRDKDTLLESPQGLIRHMWQKHDLEEYQDPDIREIGHAIDKTRERRDSKASAAASLQPA